MLIWDIERARQSKSEQKKQVVTQGAEMQRLTLNTNATPHLDVCRDLSYLKQAEALHDRQCCSSEMSTVHETAGSSNITVSSRSETTYFNRLASSGNEVYFEPMSIISYLCEIIGGVRLPGPPRARPRDTAVKV